MKKKLAFKVILFFLLLVPISYSEGQILNRFLPLPVTVLINFLTGMVGGYFYFARMLKSYNKNK